MCYLETYPEQVFGNTFCAYLLEQFLSLCEDGHESIISVEKVTVFILKVTENYRQEQWERPLLHHPRLFPCMAHRNPPQSCRLSANLLRIFRMMLRRRVKVAPCGHALQLGSNGTDVGISHNLNGRMQWKPVCVHLIPKTPWLIMQKKGKSIVDGFFFPKQISNTSPTLLNVLQIQYFQITELIVTIFLGIKCKLCSEAFSCLLHDYHSDAEQRGRVFLDNPKEKITFSGEYVHLRVGTGCPRLGLKVKVSYRKHLSL